jgi:hypothetical protein
LDQKYFYIIFVRVRDLLVLDGWARGLAATPPPSPPPHQQSSSARHVLEISTPEKERETEERRQTSLEISTSEKEYRRERGGERVIEGEGDEERVLQRMRERMFHISTAMREKVSQTDKSLEISTSAKEYRREKSGVQGESISLEISAAEREGIAGRPRNGYINVGEEYRR